MDDDARRGAGERAEAELAAGFEDSPPAVRRLGLVLGPLAFFAVLLAPGLALDPVQRKVAAVAALTATLWITSAVPLAAASLLPAVLLPLLGAVPAEKVAPNYMDDLVLLFLGAFLLALGLERWGVHRRLALFVLCRVGPNPRRLVLGFMAATAFLSMWMNNTATALLMLPIALAVIGRVRPELAGQHAFKAFAIALVLAVAYGATFGGMATPVGTAPNQVFLGQLAKAFPRAPSISFGEWVVGWLPMVVVLVLAAWFLLTRVLLRVHGTTLAGAAALHEERARLGPMRRGERTMAAMFALTALLWITRADVDLGAFVVPGWSRLVLALQGVPASEFAAHRRDVTDATVAVAMAIVCFLIPGDRASGVRLLDWNLARKVPWDVLLLIGGGFALAGAFRESGLDQVVGRSLAPLFHGKSEWVLVGAIVALVVFLSEFTSNTATASVLLPVFAKAAVAAGLDPLVTMVPVTIAASGGFMLPVSTPPNALAVATRMVPMATMARVGFVLNLVMIVLVTAVFELWVRRLWHVQASLPDWAQP